MPDFATIEQFGKWVTVAIGYAGAVAAVFLACWRYGRAAYRSLRLSDALHDRFGPDPVGRFETALAQAHADLGLQRLISDIVAHRLGLAIYICDTHGLYVWVNDTLCELFGMDSTDMLGAGWLAAVPDDQRLAAHSLWYASVAAGVPYRGRYTIKNQRTGEPVECESATYPAVVSGKVVSFVGYARRLEEECGSGNVEH